MHMRYKLLGKSELWLGTMNFGEVGRQDVYGDAFEIIDDHRPGQSGEAA
jgi:hypothetical protein